MRPSRIVLLALVLFSLVGSLPTAHAAPAAPEFGTSEARERGKNLVILGSVMQSIGVGLGIADTIGGGFLAAPRTFYSLGTIPFAPLTIHGFDLMLSDGSEVSRLRAQAGGYFEAAGYSGTVALLALTAMAVRGQNCAEAEAESGYPVCFEDVGGVFELLTTVPHALTAGAMLIPAFIVTAVADHKERKARLGGATLGAAAPQPLLVFAPLVQPGGGGIQLVGVF